MKKMMSIILTFALLMSMATTVLALPAGLDPNSNFVSGGASNIASNALGIVQWFGYALAIIHWYQVYDGIC